MPKKPRKPKKDVTPPPPSPPSDVKEERPEYYGIVVQLLHGVPAHYDHPDGEPASIVAIGRKGLIEPLVFSTRDTQRLVAALLVSLATANDEFAQKVLDGNFPVRRGRELPVAHS